MTEGVTEALSSSTFVLEKEEESGSGSGSVKLFSAENDDESRLLEDEGFPRHTGRKFLLFKLITQQMDRARKTAAVDLQKLRLGSCSIQNGSKKPLTYCVGDNDNKFIMKYSDSHSSEESLRKGESKKSRTPSISNSWTTFKYPPKADEEDDNESLPAASVTPAAATAREKYKRSLIQTLCDILDEMDDEKLRELQSKTDNFSSTSRTRKPWTIRRRQQLDEEDNSSLELDFDPVKSPPPQLQLPIQKDIMGNNDNNNYDGREGKENPQSRLQYTFRQPVMMTMIIVMMTMTTLAACMLYSSHLLLSFLPNGLYGRRVEGFCWPWNLLGSLQGGALFKGLLSYSEETDTNVYINTDDGAGNDDDDYYD